MLGDGLYDLAVDQLRRFMSNHPTHPLREEAAFLLAECYFQLGEYDRAITAYRAFITAYPAIGLARQSPVPHLESLVQAANTAMSESDPIFPPEHPNSELTLDALYWAGEANYRMGNQSKRWSTTNKSSMRIRTPACRLRALFDRLYLRRIRGLAGCRKRLQPFGRHLQRHSAG
jgi:tetratricopeptide (TPR) repeat protein